MADAVDIRYKKTGGCDTCANRIICKQTPEVGQIEAEVLTVLGKHATLSTIEIGMLCTKYSLDENKAVPPTESEVI